jgi:hypothetical protein
LQYCLSSVVWTDVGIRTQVLYRKVDTLNAMKKYVGNSTTISLAHCANVITHAVPVLFGLLHRGSLYLSSEAEKEHALDTVISSALMTRVC